MNQLNFPLQLQFKVTTLANDFSATDANGKTIAYVRQKMLKLKEEVIVYNDESKRDIIFSIKANKWLDFSAVYTFANALGQEVGRVGRKGWASLWKSRYEIYNQKQQKDLLIQEENPWIKMLDGFVGEIPILNIFTGYFLNPSYIVTRPDGTEVVRLKKEPSFFGRKFSVNKLSSFQEGEEDRIVLGLMMMILLERRRG